MITKMSFAAALAAATLVAVAAPVAQADSIAEVEGARMKDHSGWYTNRQDREKLRRFGGNDDRYYDYYGYGGGYGYYGGGPGISVYVGPRPYYGPYGY